MRKFVRIGLLVLTLMLLVSWTADAWYPASSWVYYTWPYAYDMEGADWYFYNTGNVLWLYGFGSGWVSFNTVNPHGWWYYGNGGYAYNLALVRWYYFNPGEMWTYQFGSGGGWSQFLYLGGGDVKVTLSWNNTSDTDLWVYEPSGERVYYGHTTSATGGHLDRDDRDGYGPENIYWPANAAPHGTYTVKVNHYSGAYPVSYSVTVLRDGSSQTFTGTLTQYETDTVSTFTR